VLKRVKKLGVKEDYHNRNDIKDIIRCILCAAIAACRRYPDWSARDSCDHLQLHADGWAATAAGDVCSTSMD